MSLLFSHSEELPLPDRKRLSKELTIVMKPGRYNMYAPSKRVMAYDYRPYDGKLRVPFSFDHSNFSALGKPDDVTGYHKDIEVPFKATLRENQQIVRREMTEHLHNHGCSLLAAYTGFGKTCLSLNILSSIGLQTAIITHRNILVRQWSEAIERFCGNDNKLTVLRVTSRTTIEQIKEADILLINPLVASELGHTYFKTVGFVIIDEVHLILAEKFSTSMLQFTPDFLLGLSATPYREDGMDALFKLYFGNTVIHRKMTRSHVVNIVNTKFTPRVDITAQGTVNWNVVLNSQATDRERNQGLVDSIIVPCINQNRRILVLVKRLAHGKLLWEMLVEAGMENRVTRLLGNTKYDHRAQVVIGTTGKCSTGFDKADLDTLVLACDVEAYFIQTLGRIFRRPEGEDMAVVYDIVDDNGILKKHLRTRKKVYTQIGGQFNTYKGFNTVPEPTKSGQEEWTEPPPDDKPKHTRRRRSDKESPESDSTPPSAMIGIRKNLYYNNK